MDIYFALVVAGLIFGLIALMHLLRLIYKVEITVSGKPLPMQVSLIGFIISLLLSVWMFMVSGT